MGSNIFDELLQLEDELKNDSFGEVKNPISESSDLHEGTIDDPLPFPYVKYSPTVDKLIESVYSFYEANPEYEMGNYMAVLERNGYKNIKLSTIDVSEMDEKCLMALFMALVRGERFCDGLILDALEEGAVQRWLKRLREISTGT